MAHWLSRRLSRAFKTWSALDGQRLGAALAYYGLFAMAPLLLFGVILSGALLGSSRARTLVLTQLGAYLGKQATQTLAVLLQRVARPRADVTAEILGGASLLGGALSAVMELQSALDQIWRVKPSGGALLAYARRSALALAFLLAAGVWLLASVLAGLCISVVGRFLADRLPVPEPVLHALALAASFAVLAPLFAAIFKWIPQAPVKWRHAWTGAAATALLFAIGDLLLGIYLGKAGMSSEFGAAGSLVAILVWAYYSAQILYFGAAFTHACAQESDP